MRRLYVMFGLLGIAGAILAATLSPSLSTAEANARNAAAANAEEKAKGKSVTAQQLPVTQVVLFNSGVGYFQRQGHVEGSQRIDLSFAVEDVNDLIKSMTLQDLDGGQVAAVSYDSTAPIERTLKSFAINLTGNPTFADILNQAKGEKVEVVLQQNNAAQPANMTGSIIGVETKRIKVKGEAVSEQVLNMWCADGIRNIKLSELQRIRFLNAVMDSEFRKALETLSLGHDTQKKTVSIHFNGEGKRKVRVGYVVESPIWKSSYRLVLDSKKEKKKPFLQSWAVVENTTDEDWDDVTMALISGRPISFQMNLYDPLFIKRPVVEPELFASLRPQTYTGGLGNNGIGGLGGLAGIGGGGPGGGMPPMAPPAPSNAPPGFGGFAGGGGGFGRGSGRDAYRDAAEAEMDKALALNQGVASAASASRLGDYHRYIIDHTISLPRQKSAMIPIINGEVEAKRVSIFNEQTHAKFPLRGLIFKNTTESPLMQGPITVYEGSNYAGDARILDLQKGEQRLLSYAIDLGTEVQAVQNPGSGKITNVKIIKGTMITTTQMLQSKTYTMVNRNEDERVMIVEHPHRTDFKLNSELKPWETARDVYRFKVEVPAGKTEKLTVDEEKDVLTRIALSNTDDQTIRIMLQKNVTSKELQEAFNEIKNRKLPLAQARLDLQKLERQLQDLNQDQDRIRKNLRVTPKEAKVYKRWLEKLDVQEVEIEKLRESIKDNQDKVNRLQSELDTFLANLTVK